MKKLMIWALLLTGGIMGVQTAQAQDRSRILGRHHQR